MVREAGTESEGTFILIAAVVVLLVIAALIATKFTLRSNHDNMVEESLKRKKSIADFEMQRLKAESVH